MNIQHNKQQNISKMGNTWNNICNFFSSLFTDIENYINLKKYELLNQDDIEMGNNKLSDNVDIPENGNYPGIVYDIYYHFLLKQQNNEMDDFTITGFDYPQSFSVKICDTKIDIKSFTSEKIYNYLQI